jgi:hypothetical protein
MLLVRRRRYCDASWRNGPDRDRLMGSPFRASDFLGMSMRHSLVPLLTAAAIVFGLAYGSSTAAKAESVMAACASQWKQAQAAGTTGGETWPQFLAQCRTRETSAAQPSSATFAPAPAPVPAPAPAPAPASASQSGSLFPWWQSSAPASAPTSNVGAPSALRAGEYTTELQARARCPSDTVVWVNTPSRVYHYAGTHYYGHTKRGAYMCEADARAAGNRAARKELQAHSG